MVYGRWKQEEKFGIYLHVWIWAVSIPEWPDGIKDVNDAVIRLGRLGTLLIILEAKETSKIKIELRKKQLVKRLRT